MMRFGLGSFIVRGGSMLVGCLIGLAVLVLIVLGVIALIRYLHNSNTKENHTPTSISVSNALNILDERYAHGEINDQEYATKKAELRK